MCIATCVGALKGWPARTTGKAVYSLLMAVRLSFDCACGVFGMVTVSTQFLNDVATLGPRSGTRSLARRAGHR